MEESDMTKVLLRIQAHEGFRPHPYKDSVGKLTIGHGRNLTDVGISVAEALDLLRHDVADAIAELEKYTWYAGLNPARQGALIDMMVNMGSERFREFTLMINDLSVGNFHAAAAEMRKSKWYHEVGARSVKDAYQVETGEWTPSA